MPKVSVLMPVYKTDENYLREAIESILSQTFEDFEFLILDDVLRMIEKKSSNHIKINVSNTIRMKKISGLHHPVIN